MSSQIALNLEEKDHLDTLINSILSHKLTLIGEVHFNRICLDNQRKIFEALQPYLEEFLIALEYSPENLEPVYNQNPEELSSEYIVECLAKGERPKGFKINPPQFKFLPPEICYPLKKKFVSSFETSPEDPLEHTNDILHFIGLYTFLSPKKVIAILGNSHLDEVKNFYQNIPMVVIYNEPNPISINGLYTIGKKENLEEYLILGNLSLGTY